MTLQANLDVHRGEFHLEADLTAADGEVVALIGPNGSGKTTALLALSGLLALDSGTIRIDGTSIDDPGANTFVHPNERPVSLVFQEYLLFPHLSAVENVAFGLRARGTRKTEARGRAMDLLDRFGLLDKATSRPGQLSGGQAQRVALARALATDPDLLLLDEPLAALDAGTRASVRRDLREHLRDFGGVTILVTHDPLDALALATRVVVLDDGRIAQSGPIGDLAERPRSRYVADLIGLNLLAGTAQGTTVTLPGGGTISVAEPVDGDVLVLIHPHAVAIHTARPSGSPRNQWQGTIAGFDLLGDRVRVRVTGSVPLTAEVTAGAVAELGLVEGDEVWTAVKATEITTYPR